MTPDFADRPHPLADCLRTVAVFVLCGPCGPLADCLRTVADRQAVRSCGPCGPVPIGTGRGPQRPGPSAHPLGGLCHG